MSNDLLLTMLEMLEKASQNENSGKMQQYNTRNRNVMRPVQRPSYNSGAGRRPNPYGRPDAKGEHILEGDPGFEDGQGHEGSYSLEGVGQGSLDYISPEGEQGPEGSHSTKGSAS
ncbi:hypothetical protein [Acetivibrio straminisolvens]|uniref:Uncharacterized protein n=1 Tax=Acetivibrio straminisolvens JCM 21531 TaxID=1294263 RepID=W4VAM3_9FIRM|nr:hypothetical protein [Acetivibrio straminisolvens]GAE90247.1 hypothetical protein JCM21531_3839 [Acetivibrio straminisolvens JCM 21531]